MSLVERIQFRPLLDELLEDPASLRLVLASCRPNLQVAIGTLVEAQAAAFNREQPGQLLVGLGLAVCFYGVVPAFAVGADYRALDSSVVLPWLRDRPGPLPSLGSGWPASRPPITVVTIVSRPPEFAFQARVVGM